MNNKIKQFIAFGVCSVVALAICLGVLVVTVNNSATDTSATESKTIVNKTELDATKETLTEYLNTLISKTENGFVKTKTYTDVSVDNISVLNASEKQEKDEALLNFAKDKMLPVIDSYYEEDSEGTFENDNSKKLSFVLNKNMLKNADFSIGQVDENGKSIFDDEGDLVDDEYYYLIFEIDGATGSKDKSFSKIFSLENDSEAQRNFVNEIKADCEIKSFNVEPESFIINAKVNRTNDEIQYINVIRRYAITVDAKFINAAEIFGEKEISFVYTVTDAYEYSYAGVSFVEDEVIIEHDEEYMLNVNAVIDDDSEYTVEFYSSDNDIVTIDEMGYVKGLKNSDAPVTITVKLDYLGKTFIDTCIVNVSEE